MKLSIERFKIVSVALWVLSLTSFEIHAQSDSASLPNNGISFYADVNEVPALLAQGPSVYFYSESGLHFGYTFANIRGFDQRRQAIFINGIPQNDPEDHNVYWTVIPDLLSYTTGLRVTTGVATALYGSAAMGGEVYLETTPKENEQFTVTAGYGDDNTSRLAINLSTGLLDKKYLVTAQLSQIKTNGYRDDASIDEKSFRLSLERRDENFNLKLNFYGGPVKDGLYYYGIGGNDSLRRYLNDPGLRKTNWSETFLYERRSPEHEEFFQPHYEAIASWNINARTTLSNTFFFIQGNGFTDFDGTWPYYFGAFSEHHISNSDYYRLTPQYGLRYNFTGTTDSSLGNELTRATISAQQLGWLPKLEYYHEHGIFSLGGEIRAYTAEHYGELVSADLLPIGLPDNYRFYDYKVSNNIFTGYLSELYQPSSRFLLFGGVEFTSPEYHFYDEKPFYLDSGTASLRGGKPNTFLSYDFTVPNFFVNPRFSLTYGLNDFLSLQIRSSATTRQPRLKDYYDAEFFSIPRFNRNPDGTFNFHDPNIEPEHIFETDLALILKRYLVDDDIIVSGSLTGYYMPMVEEILVTGSHDIWGSPILGNADDVLHYGLEAEATLELGSNAILKLNAAISHNEIQKFSQDTFNVIGKIPVGFPSIISGATFLLRPADGFVLSVTGKYIGEMYGDQQNSAQFKNPAYGVLDGVISYRSKSILSLQYIELKFVVNNILNTFYTSYVESGTGFFVAAPRHGYGIIQIGL